MLGSGPARCSPAGRLRGRSYHDRRTDMGIRSWILGLLALLASQPLLAQEGGGIDASIEAAIAPILNKISGAVFYSVPFFGSDLRLIVAWLVVAAVFCTIYFKFINLRGFYRGYRLIRGDYHDESAPGEVSHFQALSTAVSGTVGLGNIGGVAVAVTLGGPGATFWMVLAGFLGMATKFCECTLGVRYRTEHADGSVSGGPMHYLSKGIAERFPTMGGFGKTLAVIFAICCIGGSLGGGNMYQANQSFNQLVAVTGGAESWFADKGWLFGLGLAVITGMVVIGGIKSIAKVTSKLVPFMAAMYLLAGLVIILMHIPHLPEAIGQIISGAFSPEATFGGIVGVLIVGFQRAAFSNEAGIGSAPIAHSAVKTRYAATEGLVALWEPFLDTVVICTMTALVIIVSGQLDTQAETGLVGVALTSAAYGSVFSWFPYLLSVAVLLFAFSTMISWSYYGVKAATYLFGHSHQVMLGYHAVFLVFVVLGCSIQLQSVLDFSDAMIFMMSIPNLIGLYLLAPIVRSELNRFDSDLASGAVKLTRDK
ncbi:MAG: alanine:cation symporter family protein [Xanthomonadales bacterium]|nr:alanine:cation symporter family protein [Xanthomonadales bacterium]